MECSSLNSSENSSVLYTAAIISDAESILGILTLLFDVLGCINRCIESGSLEAIFPLCSAVVRPHLEYHIQFCTPHFKKTVDKLGRVQRKATNVISLETKSYKKCLKELGMFSQEKK